MSLKQRATIIKNFTQFRDKIKPESNDSTVPYPGKEWSDAQIEVLARAIQHHFLQCNPEDPANQEKFVWKEVEKNALTHNLRRARDGDKAQNPFSTLNDTNALGQMEDNFNPLVVDRFIKSIIKLAIKLPPPDAPSKETLEAINTSTITIDNSYQKVVDQIIDAMLVHKQIAPELMVCHRQLVDLKSFDKDYNRLHDRALNYYKLTNWSDNVDSNTEYKTFYARINNNKLEYFVINLEGDKVSQVHGTIEANELAEIIKPLTIAELTNNGKNGVECLQPYFPKILALAAKDGRVNANPAYKHMHLTLGKKGRHGDAKREINWLLNKYDPKYHILINHSTILMPDEREEHNGVQFIPIARHRMYLQKTDDVTEDADTIVYTLVTNNPDNANDREIIVDKITVQDLPELKTLNIDISRIEALDNVPINQETKEQVLTPNVLYTHKDSKYKNYVNFCIVADNGKTYTGQVPQDHTSEDLKKTSEYIKYKLLETQISSIVSQRRTKTKDGSIKEIAAVTPVPAFIQQQAPNPRVGMIIETFATAGSRAISISNTIDLLRRFDWGNPMGGSDALPRPEGSSLGNTQSVFSTVFSGFLFIMFPVEWVYNWFTYGIKPDWLEWWSQRNSNRENKMYFPWGTVKDFLLGCVYLGLSVTSLFAQIANVGFAYVGLGLFDSAMDLSVYLLERYRVGRDIANNEDKIFDLEGKLSVNTGERVKAMESLCMRMDQEYKKPAPDADVIKQLMKEAADIDTAHQKECMAFKAALVEYGQLKIRAYRSTSTFALIRQSARTFIAVIGVIGAILSLTPAAPVGFIMVAIAAFFSLLIFCAHTYHRFWMAGNITDLRNAFINKEHDHKVNQYMSTKEISKQIAAIKVEKLTHEINSKTYSKNDFTRTEPAFFDAAPPKVELQVNENSTDYESARPAPSANKPDTASGFDVQNFGSTSLN